MQTTTFAGLVAEYDARKASTAKGRKLRSAQERVTSARGMAGACKIGAALGIALVVLVFVL